MNFSFPAPDPIPLPAPVWLFKFLNDLTLTLHFAFLHLLIGGLVLAIVWNFWGRLRKRAVTITASGVVVNRLPIVMTYVINFGIPPLLFTQVLYGRALYTSSVLIGVYWISVIFAVIIAYALLYVAGKLSEKGLPWWPVALVSLFFVAYVGKIYSTNMTLMLRPEVWQGMYDATAMGTRLPPFDPTKWPRFALMMIASLAFGGIGSTLYSTKRALTEDVKIYLRTWGGALGFVASLGLAGAGVWAYNAQPGFVREALQASELYKVLILAWFACLGLSSLGALVILLTPRTLPFVKILFATLPALLAIASYVIVREGVRDFTLLYKGFDVWQRAVNTNWTVVILFFVSLLAGVGGLIWLLTVLRRAKSVEETYA